MNKQRALAELARRSLKRKLFTEYSQIWNVGQVGAYPWQVDFHNAGGTHLERMLIKANQVGGTTCAAAEVACHLVGIYPTWWEGVRYDAPVRCWIGSESAEASRDVPQAALLGPEGAEGTGWVPGEKIVPGSMKARQSGVSGVVDGFRVFHVSGGQSQVTFKTYEQGRRKWQGAVRDLIWMDEEPPFDIYTEALTRVTNAKNGRILVTFTPLIGATEVVRHFLEKKSDAIYVKNVSWEDAPHLDEKKKKELWESYPEHERATRTSGQPLMGTGVVFPINDEEITCEPFALPDFFYRINGLDFGIDHPFACAFCAWDKDNDVFYLYDALKNRGHTPVYHADGIKAHGTWIPNAWPHDGLQKDKGSGIALKDQYRSKGLYMLKEHSHYLDERGNHVEPALIEMLEWMRGGRFKIFRTAGAFFEEKHMYHRKDGKVVPLHDDLISATRMAFIMRRYARIKQVVPVSRGPRRPIIGRRW